MSTDEDGAVEKKSKRRRRKDYQPLWFAAFEWQWWLTNCDVRRLTPEQRGRFMDVFAMTNGSTSPGVMKEEDVCAWAGYDLASWKADREALKHLFTMTRSGK